MADKKMTDEEIIQWKELCTWIEINILNYDIKVQRLQKKACLILRGLQCGQTVANGEYDKYGYYPFNVILMTFKANKTQIVKGIKYNNIEDESKKMYYACAIVRDKLNDMYSRYLNAQKAQEKVEYVDTSIMTNEGAEYKSTNAERKVNKRLEGLW